MRCAVLSFLMILLAVNVYSSEPQQTLFPPRVQVLYAINAGGPEYTALDGTHYTADYTSLPEQSSTHTTTDHIVGNDTELYQSERYGRQFSYSFPLEKKGYYTLVLKFAEVYFKAPKLKEFDILINEVPVIRNLDIFQRAGDHVAYDEAIKFHFSGTTIKLSETQKVPAKNKEMIVTFAARKDNAKICALALVKGIVEKKGKAEPSGKGQEGGSNWAIVAVLLLLACVGGFAYTQHKPAGPSKKERLSQNMKAAVSQQRKKA